MTTVSILDFFKIRVFFFILLFAEMALANSAQVDLYFSKQSSHTLRVATTVIRLLGDSDFLTAHPEYESIAAKAKSSLRTSLVHDKAKTLNTPFNEVLANSYGVDYRSLPDSDPQKKKIIEAIRQLNEKDEKFWKRAMLRFSLDKNKQKLLEQLVGAADYNDVPMSRIAEFGNGKIRKIDKASEWIPKLTHLSEDERRGMTRVALYLEENSEKFKDIYTEVTPKNLQKNGTQSYIKSLKSEASSIQKSARPVFTAQAAGKIVGATGLLVAPSVATANYVKDPVFAKPVEDFFEMVSGSSDIAQCQTIGCSRLFQECKSRNLNEEMCILYFFQKPLHEQTQLRLNDDLDSILKSKAPLVTNLSCKKSKKQIEQIRFSTINYNNEVQVQELNIDTFTKIQNIKVSLPTGQLRPADLIEFSNNEPSNLILYQKPRVSKYSTNGAEWSSLTIPKKDWKDKNMYFWTSGTEEQKNQIKRSQEALRSIRYQQSSLVECCDDNRCLSYFTKLQNDQRSTKAGHKSAQAYNVSR